MAQGACNCGAVAFEIDRNNADIFMCHCSICRRYTGANGVAVIVVNNSDFRWLKGEDNITNWSKTDADWQSWFCRTCGSAVPGKNDDAHMFIPAGLLSEGVDGSRVAHHIWVGSKAGWDEIGDSGKQHVNAFKG